MTIVEINPIPTPVCGNSPVAIVLSFVLSFLLSVPLLEAPLLFVLSWFSVLFVIVPSTLALIVFPVITGQDSLAMFPEESFIFPPSKLTVASCPLSLSWILYEYSI